MNASVCSRCLLGLALLSGLPGAALGQGKGPAGRPPAAPARAPTAAVAIWSAGPTEPPPPELVGALRAQGVLLLPGGPRAAAGQTLLHARRAFAELRCGEALPALAQAEERLLADVAISDGKALLAEIEALILACADRLGDSPRAARAADRLLMTGAAVPPDVALVLRRYRPGPLFGPPPPPTQVETDPKGAQVIRNLLEIGQAPIPVPGGDPDVDMLDVEMPGWRKVHRPLGSGEKLGLGLRTEDRLPVLTDAVAARPLGSDVQGAALALLQPALRAGQLPARVLVLGPAQGGGAQVVGERLRARVYDAGGRRWLAAVADVAAGPPQRQAAALLALVGGKPLLVAAAGKPSAAKKNEPSRTIGGWFKLPFGRTKWYSWVIAGGVAALIAGLLIADHFSSDSVTVQATR